MLSHVTVALTTVLLLSAVDGAAPVGKKQWLNIHKGTIVHLFDWKWEDIARECEEFLGPRGFAAVQTSPPHENLIITGRPWSERLQVVSYKLISRSGNEEQLADMLRRCNKVGVRVFAHAVINHMTTDTDNCEGVGGSKCDALNMDYPAVPYNKSDFNERCNVDWNSSAREMRECEFSGLHDLDYRRENVQARIVEYLNHLISIGFAGFRIDSAMYIYPYHLAAVYNQLHALNTSFGLPNNTKPLIYQEVHDMGGTDDKVSFTEYTNMGLITDARYKGEINTIFLFKNPLHLLRNFGVNLAPDRWSVVTVDGYEHERDSRNPPLTFKKPVPYRMAIAFMLAWGHGYPTILSGYNFENVDDGPPSDENDKILSPDPDQMTNVCKNGWICQHRWRQVYSMVAFNRAVLGAPVSSWWDNGDRQIAFSRGQKGFVAFNMETQPLNMTLQTNLPPGKYCDVISGSLVDGKCGGGAVVEVDGRGHAEIYIKPYDEFDYQHDGVLAIFDHETSRLAAVAR